MSVFPILSFQESLRKFFARDEELSGYGFRVGFLDAPQTPPALGIDVSLGDGSHASGSARVEIVFILSVDTSFDRDALNRAVSRVGDLVCGCDWLDGMESDGVTGWRLIARPFYTNTPPLEHDPENHIVRAGLVFVTRWGRC